MHPAPIRIQTALPLLDDAGFAFHGGDILHRVPPHTLEHPDDLFECSHEDSTADVLHDPPSPLTPLLTPETHSLDLPLVSDDALPLVHPKTKDFAQAVLGVELSENAPVIEWPNGFKTVVPFLPTKDDPTKNALALVCHCVRSINCLTKS